MRELMNNIRSEQGNLTFYIWLLFYFTYALSYWKWCVLTLLLLNLHIFFKVVLCNEPKLVFNRRRPLLLFTTLYQFNLIETKRRVDTLGYFVMLQSLTPYFLWSLLLGFSFRFFKLGVNIFIEFKKAYWAEEMYSKKWGVWILFFRKTLTKILILEFNPPQFLPNSIEVTVFGVKKTITIEVIHWIY